ncbi:MAG: hypothetical protein FWF52_01115 [Candidatus Azobacteroides sp.]|nr:hypothetical protein [Candidatus Azobacteroides sp.]
MMQNENQESNFYAIFTKLFLAAFGIIFIVVVILSLYFVISAAFKSKQEAKAVQRVKMELPVSDAGGSIPIHPYQYLLYSKADMKIKRDSGITSFAVATLKGIKGFTQRGVPIIHGMKNRNLADAIVSANGEYNGVPAVADLLLKNESASDAACWLVGIYIWQSPEGNAEHEQWMNE